MDFLINMLEEQYGTEKAKKIIEGYTKQRAVTFRVNTLKSNVETIENKLKEAKIEYEKTLWSKEAFIIKNANEQVIQELDIYKNGEIYLQSLSSMLPPIILKPQEGADILDMAAAPGGKTREHIVKLNKNRRVVSVIYLMRVFCKIACRNYI